MDYKKYALVDLHLHLDGSLSPEIIIEVAKEEGINLPTYDAKELRKYLEVPEDCKSLNEYLERFDIPNRVLQSKNGLYKCMLNLLKREADAGLKYVEVRMAPQLSTQKGLKQNEVVEILLQASKDAFDKYKIKSNLILCLMRMQNNMMVNLKTIEVAAKYLNKGVVALDLAGAEALFPNENFEALFELARNMRIPFTIHAGEASGAESVRSAINMGASRIGHGIHSIDDESVMKSLVEKKIPLEICPKSNLDTKTIKSFEELPIREFLKRGIIVTLNTDDMTVSSTNLVNEYNILSSIGYSDEELKTLSENTIKSAFISDKEKEELLSYLN
ncbi:MAG: adenosine deaminase [Bacilli bacterium]|nr:adenosine deaminase [Bacilli bacterium]